MISCILFPFYAWLQKHTDSISAFAISRSGAYVATGQAGHEPFVAVWSATTCQVAAIIPDLQMRSASALAFSKSGVLLAVVSADRDHTITIYDWRASIPLSRFSGGSRHIMAVCFSDTDDGLAAVGIKDIRFWSNITCRYPTCVKPTLGEIGAWQPFHCAAYFGINLIVGSSDGNLYVFETPTALHHTVKAHRGALQAMDVSRDDMVLATGGKDGAVRLWNRDFDCIKEILVDSVITSQNPRVRSVAFSADATNVVIGTRGAEIFEVVIRSGALVGSGPLVNGHGTRELWGLATHPTKEQFVTSGDDATIRLWDAKSFSLLRTVKMDTASRTIAYSPNGKYIAVGFGHGHRARGKAASKEGSFVVLSASDLRIVHEGKDSSEPIRVVKFSPDSKILSVGSEDAQIYNYNVKDSFTRKSTVTTHKAPVLHIDFSVDGQFLMSVDATKRICFSEVNSGINIPSPAALRDEKWSTWSSPVGWPMQGMWLCQPKSTEPHSAQRSWNGMLVGVGNTCGRLFVSHYPCPQRAGFASATGHAGPIAHVAWVAGDGTVLTIGRKDHTIMQWKCIFDNARESGDEGGLSCQDSGAEREVGIEGSAFGKNIREPTEQVPQWQTSICPPSDQVEFDDTIPSQRLDIEVTGCLEVIPCTCAHSYSPDRPHQTRPSSAFLLFLIFSPPLLLSLCTACESAMSEAPFDTTRMDMSYSFQYASESSTTGTSSSSLCTGAIGTPF